MISWHIHLSFEGERGPQGSRGRPGEDGLKGAKVREGIVLWVDSDREMTQWLPKSSASVQRPPTLELRLCVLGMLPKLPQSVSVIINTFSREIVLQKMCLVPFCALLNSHQCDCYMWAAVKVMATNVFCYLLSSREIKDYQGQGVRQENQGHLEQMCVFIIHHNHQHCFLLKFMLWGDLGKWTVNSDSFTDFIFSGPRVPGEIQEMLDQGATLDLLDLGWANTSTFLILKFN